MQQEKLKVLFRMVYNKYIKADECIAVLPQMPANYGCVVAYTEEGHTEIHLSVYQTTKPASAAQYAKMYKQLASVYDEYKIDVKQKLNYTDLRNSWNCYAKM